MSAAVKNFDLTLVNNILSERQEEIFDSLSDHNADSNGFIRGQVFSNVSDGDGLGSAKGVVFLFDGETKISSEMFPDNIFECVVMNQILASKTELSEKNFSAIGKNLASVATTYSDQPCGLDIQDSVTKLDKSEWAPELGPTGEAGIYKDSSAWNPKYYLVVKGSLPKLNDDLHELIQANEFTMKEFHDSPAVSWSRHAAERNVLRMSERIARKCGFRLTSPNHMVVVPDFSSSKSANESFAHMSIPDHVQYNSTFISMPFESRKVYATFNDVVPYYDCDSRLMVYSGTSEGYSVFDTSDSNPPNIGFPATTIKQKNATDITTADIQNQDLPHKDSFMWLKGSKDVNTLLDANMYAKVDAPFKQSLNNLGLKKTQPQLNLHAVCVKIPHGNETRHNE